MRVISGLAKGHRLQPVPGDATRPITDRVKESLFNILGASIEDARVLDLFAGTGAVGIEALSRGAADVVFVDKAPAALRTVRLNLEHTRLADHATILHTDAFKYLSGPTAQPFDVIYVAPPQYRGWWAEILQLLDTRPEWLVRTDTYSGITIAQIHPREHQEPNLHLLTEYDRRKYGSTMLCFYTLKSALDHV
jgi:16S rRNA (guanine966-N2)-methyltransferase